MSPEYFGEKLFGLDAEQVFEVRKKLDALGISIGDLLEFLDRDKLILFAELKVRIAYLEGQIARIREILEEVGDDSR